MTSTKGTITLETLGVPLYLREWCECAIACVYSALSWVSECIARTGTSLPVMRQVKELQIVETFEGARLKFSQAAAVEFQFFQLRQMDKCVILDHLQLRVVTQL